MKKAPNVEGFHFALMLQGSPLILIRKLHHGQLNTEGQ